MEKMKQSSALNEKCSKRSYVLLEFQTVPQLKLIKKMKELRLMKFFSLLHLNRINVIRQPADFSWQQLINIVAFFS